MKIQNCMLTVCVEYTRSTDCRLKRAEKLIIFSGFCWIAHISGIRMPGQSRLDATFVRNFYPPSLQPTFRSRVLVLTWANWLNCPYINNPNTLVGSRPLLTTPVTLPPSSCLARYLTFQSAAISNIFEKHSHVHVYNSYKITDETLRLKKICRNLKYL